MTRAPYLFPCGASLGVDNVVLQARAKRHRVDSYPGPLSVKTVLTGEVAWIVGGRELVVNRTSFLVVNAGEPYSMNIDAPRPVETCCIFFAPGFVEQVAADVTSPPEPALDLPEPPTAGLPYLSALHSDCERGLARRVQSLAPRCRGALAPSAFEEDFLMLAEELLGFYNQIRDQAARLPAVRKTTRDELFRRVLLGRDYVHSSLSGPLSLLAVAQTAHLSPFHFHRAFTAAFQQTPHAYITALRLEQARQLIQAGMTVLEACLDVGFSSPSAFSRLFRSRYGEPPSAVRRKFARSGKTARAKSSTLSA